MMTARRIFKSLAILWGMTVLLTLAEPATGHKDHKKKPVQTEHSMPMPPDNAMQAAPASAPEAMHRQMGEMMEDEAVDRSNMSPWGRLLDWLGRTHPVIVHFPIAFFPAALLTATVGRRRPAFAAPVQFLVIAGGIIAPIAALFGWLDAMNADPDALLTVHRWLGTAIGVGALGLGVWAWRRPEANRGAGLIAGLGLITIAIVIQGWFGGAMVHGVDHMNW